MKRLLFIFALFSCSSSFEEVEQTNYNKILTVNIYGNCVFKVYKNDDILLHGVLDTFKDKKFTYDLNYNSQEDQVYFTFKNTDNATTAEWFINSEKVGSYNFIDELKRIDL